MNTVSIINHCHELHFTTDGPVCVPMYNAILDYQSANILFIIVTCVSLTFKNNILTNAKKIINHSIRLIYYYFFFFFSSMTAAQISLFIFKQTTMTFILYLSNVLLLSMYLALHLTAVSTLTECTQLSYLREVLIFGAAF